MRWSAFTLGAVTALAGTAYGSYGGGMMLDNSVGSVDSMFQRRSGDQADGLLESRQSSGRCGASYGNAKCPSGQCCSQWGYCGVGAEFCNPIALCQSDYGSCLGASQSSTAAAAPSTTAPAMTTTTPAMSAAPSTTTPAAPAAPSSTTPAAPAAPTTTSTTAAAPPPASSASSASSAAPPASTGTLTPSTNGMCGNATTCAGSGHGSCCSQFFYCGDGIAYCGTGCQSKFGLCFGGARRDVPAGHAVLDSFMGR